MKNLRLTFILLATLAVISVNGQTSGKYVSELTHIKFFSTTPVEDIEAHNYSAVSTIEPSSGEVVFSVPMQSFEFEKAMMQKHFNNENFLVTNEYPKAKFKGTITNLDEIDFTKKGEYKAEIQGELTIKDKTNPVKETGTITVKGKNVEVNSTFNITLADYGVAFDEGEMVAKKIGKTVEITVVGKYNIQ
jgi:polyisoprenoid-binding protein YceI